MEKHSVWRRTCFNSIHLEQVVSLRNFHSRTVTDFSGNRLRDSFIAKYFVPAILQTSKLAGHQEPRRPFLFDLHLADDFLFRPAKLWLVTRLVHVISGLAVGGVIGGDIILSRL